MPYVGQKPADIIATAVDTTTGTFSGNVDVDGTLNTQGETTLQTHLNMGDNDIIKLGDGADLQIKHDASNSFITDAGTGNLYLDSTVGNIYLRVNASENAIEAVQDGAVTLYHNNVAKLATSSTGVNVTGTADSTLSITAGGTSNDSLINFVHGSTTDGGITYDHNGAYASEVMQFRTGNNTANMTLNGAGTLTVANGVTLTDGNLVVASGHGIDFSAAGNESGMSSELLSDYEEGTFTATLEGTTTTPSTALTATGSSYTKIGNIVYVTMAFANLNTAGYAGGIRVSGLPFSASPGNQLTGNVAFHAMGTIPSGSANIAPFFAGTNVDFYVSITNAAWSQVTHNAGTGSYLYFTGVYKT